MKNLFTLLAATAMVGISAGAYATDESSENKSKVEYKDNGGYEATRSSESTDANGTTVSSDSKVDVDVDSKGRVSKTVKSTSKTDPKGWWHGKTDKAKTDYEEKERGGYKQTTTHVHTDADGTNVTYKTVTDVDVDEAGNVTTTAKTEKTVDPKGLMNKKTSTSTTKSVNGQVVEQKKKSD